MVKRFILNADGLGLSNAYNCAVKEAYKSGFLKSVSLVANGEAFDEAVKNILPECQDFGVGVCLNVTSGKSLCADLNTLTDEKLNFKNNYFKLLFLAYNPKNKDFMPQLEREFRRQIETAMSKTKICHINSKDHIHSIPPIFNLVCRLAKEYQIPQIRTHFEKIYIIPEVYRNLTFKFFKNFSKKLFLNFLTVINENTVHKYELQTNDYIIGINYEGLMDAIAVTYGIKVLKYENITVETVIYPARYEDGTIDTHFDEYIITKNKKLEDKIKRSGYDITNYMVKNENTSE